MFATAKRVFAFGFVTSFAVILLLGGKKHLHPIAMEVMESTFTAVRSQNGINVTNRTEVYHRNYNATQVLVKQNGFKLLYVTAYNLQVGRLGNQMFRYASLLGIARAQGRRFIVPPGSHLEECFKLQHVTDGVTTKGWHVISESNANSFNTELMKLPQENVSITGYLQSFKYFSDFMDTVRQEYTFKDAVANQAASILHEFISNYKGNLIVGVHARRGDFVYKQSLGYGVPNKSYFMKSFNLIKSKFPDRNVTFLVASDDLEWCTESLARESVVILKDAPPEVHMAIMAGCDHVIIAGGTFGWWSGWLAGGHVIYYNGFMTNDTTIGKIFVPNDYYPPLWIGLGN